MTARGYRKAERKVPGLWHADAAQDQRLAGYFVAYLEHVGVVLVHGHPFDRTVWQPQLAALRSGFRVVAPDLRGFGDSPVTPHLVTMRELAADIEELLGILGIGRAAVVGLSMGGLVTMELAASQPERYWAIGLVATTMQPPAPSERAVRGKRAEAVERDGMQVLLDYMHTGLYGPNCPASVRARVDAMMSAAPSAGAAAALRGRAERPDYRGLLAASTSPRSSAQARPIHGRTRR